MNRSNKSLIIYCMLICATVLFSCTNNEYNPTPPNFKSIVKVSRSEYTADTILIHKTLSKMLSMHLSPFVSKNDDLNTQISVDSVVYSPNGLRMIVLFTVKNDAKKLLLKENDSTYYYDAYYLFCSKDSLNSSIKVYNRSGFGLVNFYNYKDIKEALYDYCFLRLSGKSDKEIHYNIDDVRFWGASDFEWVVKNSTPTVITSPPAD